MGVFDWIFGRNRTNARQEMPRDMGDDRAVPTIFISSSTLPMIGLWHSDFNSSRDPLGFPHPELLMDPDWEKKRRRRIVNYLRHGDTLMRWEGYSFCRFKECRYRKRERLGSRDLTDGRWVWPEGLWHYVADHHVRLPDEFVANAADQDFVVPKIAQSAPVSISLEFWLQWVAENTTAPSAAPDACSLEEAQAICAKLSTTQWTASITLEHGRWRLRTECTGQSSSDFTRPISSDALHTYLFRFRPRQAQSVLDWRQALTIASEYVKRGHIVRPFMNVQDRDDERWWAVVTPGFRQPTKPLAEIDFTSIEIPMSGRAILLPNGWKLEVMRGMDEVEWRSYLEKWQRI